jgi:hypothetical protein
MNMQYIYYYYYYDFTSSLRLNVPFLIKSNTLIDVVINASSTFSPVFADASKNNKPFVRANCSPSCVLYIYR